MDHDTLKKSLASYNPKDTTERRPAIDVMKNLDDEQRMRVKTEAEKP